MHPSTELLKLIEDQKATLDEADRVDVTNPELAAYLRQCASEVEADIIALREQAVLA